MKILLTGGAGYIGSVLTGILLKEGHSVRSVDILWYDEKIPLIYLNDPSYEFFRGDICDNSFIDKMVENCDCVIHTAAVVGEPACKKYPDLARKVNKEASINLIKLLAEKKNKKFIFFSTCSNYGVANETATEDTPLKPLSVYAETKVEVEKYLLEKVTNLDWVILRLSTVYGASPRMRFDLTVADFTMNGLLKKQLEIFLPNSFRPYIHVFDIASVMAKLLKNFTHCKKTVYNLGFEGENYQKIEIAKLVKKYVPDLNISILKEGYDLRDYQVDFSKLKNSLGYKKQYGVEDGVKEVIKIIGSGLIKNPYDNLYNDSFPNLGGTHEN